MLSLQLRSAATDGSVAVLERLLKDVAPRARDEDGATPLHYAAWAGALALCERLIDAKADLRATDYAGRTPLHYAAAYGRGDVARRLLTAGADPNAPDTSGYTPLHLAAEARWDGGGGGSSLDGVGVGAVSGAIGGMYNGDAGRYSQMVRLLLAAGASATARDTFDRTPLDVAGPDPSVRRELVNHTAPTASAARLAPSDRPSAQGAVETWSTAAVGVWLRAQGLGAYEAVFAEKGITGRYLLTRMTDDKAARLIADEFHRDNFVDALADLKRSAAAAQAGAAEPPPPFVEDGADGAAPPAYSW